MYELCHDFEIHLVQNDVTSYLNLLDLDSSKDVVVLMINDYNNANKYEKVSLKEEYPYCQFLIEFYVNVSNDFRP